MSEQAPQRGRWKAPYNLDRLVEVAVRVFTERGYDGTSLQHLTQASGLSRSSIYHHIESKEQLLRLGLERALEPLLASTTDDGATSGRALDRLTYLIKRNVEILAAELPYVRLLLSVHGNTETERWALDQRRTFDKFVAGVVQEAIDDGDVRADLDARTTARLIFGTINSLAEWYRPARRRKPGELADQICSMILRGIQA
ncbi:TetR/AcrR family transcriptional regulator [Lentzea terrae]|uniref:TetR/AcrR family transcriptional regulator n=1 Tax=Lentzea terrae TaxID=2200761 RepID=UPI000DD451A2|nr:TetR/AcrR family transcriptional regulator [Lentzea terrae]